jgi:hypothetical protein
MRERWEVWRGWEREIIEKARGRVGVGCKKVGKRMEVAGKEVEVREIRIVDPDEVEIDE